MEVKDKIKILELFNLQATRLKNSRFFHQIQEKRLATIQTISKISNGENINTFFYDEDAINSFILPLRFLIQDNEKCSINNIGKLYECMDIPKEYKQDFDRIRKSLNDYLDKETTLLLPKEELSRRKILDTFLYGFFAHANEKKRLLFQKWMKIPVFGGLIASEFLNSIIVINTTVQYITEKINEKTIDYLEKQNSK